MNFLFIPSRVTKRSAALLGLVTTIFVSLLPPHLHGQSVDYNALEQLFKEPVTASVTGSPQRVSDVPATMVIITAEDIRRSGAKDIPGVLRHVGGVNILEWGNDDVDVGIRGYNQAYSSRLLVLIDGRQVYADYYGYIPWSALPVELDAIRQIEIIKGPNSALFGFNAVGGVINIVTYDPLYDHVSKASFTRGTQNLTAGSGVVTRELGSRVVTRLSAGGHGSDAFSTTIPPSEGMLPRQNQYRAAVDVDGVIRLNDKMHLGIETSYSAAQHIEITPTYAYQNSLYGTASAKLLFSAEGRFGILQATAYTNWLKLQGTSFINKVEFNNRVTVAEVHDIFKVGAHHTFRAAVEYRHNTESSTPTTGAEIHYHVISGSGMWDWKITPAVSLTNALRIDSYRLGRDGFVPSDYPFSNSDWNKTFIEPSFNTGLVWRPREADAVRLTISRGAQLPSLAASGAFLADSPFFRVTGTPLLQPTIVTNYEVSWDHATPVPQILFRVSAFHQRSTDLVAVGGGIIPTATVPYITFINAGDSNANGLEAGLRGALWRRLRWSANYQPEWIVDHFVPSAQNGAAYIDFQHTTPRHQAKASIGWSGGKWEIDGYLQYQSSTHGLLPNGVTTGLVSIPAYLSVDGRVAYNLTDRFTWSVSGQNLSHDNQIQTSGVAVERRVLGTMTFHF